MLLDRDEELHRLAQSFRDIAEGKKAGGVFPAETSGSPAPYAAFLNGIRISMLAKGESELRLTEDQWLSLQLTPHELATLARRIGELENGNHEHLNSAPMALIIEADDTWPGFEER